MCLRKWVCGEVQCGAVLSDREHCLLQAVVIVITSSDGRIYASIYTCVCVCVYVIRLTVAKCRNSAHVPTFHHSIVDR